jgi:outer membrane protein assembly factor BamB
MKTRTLLIFAAYLCALALPVGAADWPQWRGPNRDGISKETGLLRSWPQNGPPLVWTYEDAGVGYSGPAVVGDRLFTLGGDGETEYVYALDIQAEKPKKVWSTEVAPLFKQGRGDGPRGNPTVDGDLLYAIGGQGELICVETATGQRRWHCNLRSELGGQMMSGWGYSESPLVDGDKVVCTPGGSQGTLAALDKKTGKVLWRSKDFTDAAGYSSLVVTNVGGIRQYVQMTGQSVAGVAVDDGRLLWRFERRSPTAAIPTPIVHDNLVYVSSGYGTGCTLLRLNTVGNGVIQCEQVYANKNLVNHHGGVVLVGEYVYGYSDGKGWVCQDLKSGKTVWEEKRKLGKGAVTYADGHLYCYSEDAGTLVLVEATPDGWKEDGRFKIPRETTVRKPQGKIWTHPVVANGRLYLRDQDLLFCYNIKELTRSAR